MSDDIIPDDVRAFILRNIDSVAQLEGLLQLRADSSAACSAASMAKKLYIAPPDSEKLLERLRERGFLTASGGGDLLYRYQPQSAGIEEMVARVTDLYARYLIPITLLIHSKSKNKIQAFADAFWIRKD